MYDVLQIVKIYTQLTRSGAKVGAVVTGPCLDTNSLKAIM
jgi:hypothetical protein